MSPSLTTLLSLMLVLAPCREQAAVEAIPVAEWTGRVVDEQGAPLAGARVVFLDPDALAAMETRLDEESWLDLAWRRRTDVARALLPAAISDADGRFGVASQGATLAWRRHDPRPLVVVTAPGRAGQVLSLPTAGQVGHHLGDLPLPALETVRGRVIDAVTEAPVAGAELAATWAWTYRTSRLGETSRQMDAVAPTAYRLAIALAGDGPSCRSDAAGRFALELVPGRRDLSVRRAAGDTARRVSWEADDVELVVRVTAAQAAAPTRVVGGRVLADDGAPVEGLQVLLGRGEPNFGRHDVMRGVGIDESSADAAALAARCWPTWSRAVTDADGRWRLEVASDADQQLWLGAPGWRTRRLALFAGEGDHDLTTVVERAPALRLLATSDDPRWRAAWDAGAARVSWRPSPTLDGEVPVAWATRPLATVVEQAPASEPVGDPRRATRCLRVVPPWTDGGFLVVELEGVAPRVVSVAEAHAAVAGDAGAGEPSIPTVTLDLSPAETVRLVFVDGSGAPAVEVPVALTGLRYRSDESPSDQVAWAALAARWPDGLRSDARGEVLAPVDWLAGAELRVGGDGWAAQDVLFPLERGVDRFVVERVGSVAGWVVDTEGERVAGALLRCATGADSGDCSPLPWPTSGLAAASTLTTITTSDGAFRLDGLAPGRYCLIVLSRAGGAGGPFPVEVEAGAEVRLYPKVGWH